MGNGPGIQEGVVINDCTDEQCKLRIDANVLTQMPCSECPITGDFQIEHAKIMPVNSAYDLTADLMAPPTVF